MKIKAKLNKLTICLILIIIICISSLGLVAYKYYSGIDFTLLSPQTNSQMLGIIIKTNNGKVIVIDGGTRGDSDNLLKYIKDYGNKVDYWFLTHPHMDHVGAFETIAQSNKVDIKNVILSLNTVEWVKENDPKRVEQIEDLNKVLNLDHIKKIIKEPSVQEMINIDNLKVEFLGIKNPEITNNAGNNSSMIMKLYINNKSILILGDTGVESGNKLINTVPNKIKSDYVQMAHHGQKGVDENFYKLVNPKVCFWPTTKWLWINDSGQGEDSGTFKTKETRKWMEDLNVKTNYIAKDGDVTIKIW